MAASVHFPTLLDQESGFTFRVLELTEDQAGRWDDHRSAFLGPMTRQQAFELYWRPKKIRITAKVWGSLLEFDWGPDPDNHDEGSYGYDGSYRDSTINEELDFDLEPEGDELGMCSGISTRSGTGRSDNFDISVLLTLFAGAMLVDNDNVPIIDDPDAPTGEVVKAGDDYFVSVTASVQATLRGDVHLPRGAMGYDVYVGPTVYAMFYSSYSEQNASQFFTPIEEYSGLDFGDYGKVFLQAVSASGAMDCSKQGYWPYKNSAGSAVFDFSSGAQIATIS